MFEIARPSSSATIRLKTAGSTFFKSQATLLENEESLRLRSGVVTSSAL